MLIELLIEQLRLGIETYPATNLGSHWVGEVPLIKGWEEGLPWWHSG